VHDSMLRLVPLMRIPDRGVASAHGLHRLPDIRESSYRPESPAEVDDHIGT